MFENKPTFRILLVIALWGLLVSYLGFSIPPEPYSLGHKWFMASLPILIVAITAIVFLRAMSTGKFSHGMQSANCLVVVIGSFFALLFWGNLLYLSIPVWTKIICLLIAIYFHVKWFRIGYYDYVKAGMKLKIDEKMFTEFPTHLEYTGGYELQTELDEAKVETQSPFKDWMVWPLVVLLGLAPSLGLVGSKVFGGFFIMALVAGLSFIVCIWGMTYLSKFVYFYKITRTTEARTGKSALYVNIN